jgi:3-dehydroquinate dehydratase-1
MKRLLVVDPRGRKPAGETPLICTPLVGETKQRLLAEATSIVGTKKPDALEWRVDHFKAIADTAAVLDTARALRDVAGTLPIIFTCRSAAEGGHRVPLGQSQIVDLHEAMSESRLVEFVDFELGNDPDHVRRVRERTHSHEVRLILSYHNTSFTPGVEFMVDRFLEAERLGADVAMVQVKPRNRADVLRLLAATMEADDKTRIPLISMSVGPLGSVTRMVGGLFGSSLSFAVGEKASAPGQIPIGDLVTVFDILRRARGGEMW